MNLDHIKEAVNYLKEQGVELSSIGVVLGTGLGKFTDVLSDKIIINYKDIPHFPLSTVEFHSGKLVQGYLHGKKVIVLQGRLHYYEGYSMDDIVFPIRVFKMLGIQLLILSNAAGALNLNFKKGSLMLISDHVDLFPSHPLIGKNDNSLGSRFPDMSQSYDVSIIDIFEKEAKDLNISIEKGIYISAQGPMLETSAEYRMLRNIGADAVGMSTIPEVVAARHMGMKCCGISILTDECDPDNLNPIDIDEIIKTASATENIFILLLKNFLLNYN